MPEALRATAALLATAWLTLVPPVCAQTEPLHNTTRTPLTPPVGGAMAWSGLSAEQQSALRPLRELWPSLGADHQRKWLALAQNFSRLPAHEQATLQQRMSEWARLSPAQRARARLNFDRLQRIPDDQRLERWQQYQALSAAERAQLTQEHPKPPPVGMAPALRRTPTAPVPSARGTPRQDAALNRHTLLPQPPEPPAENRR